MTSKKWLLALAALGLLLLNIWKWWPVSEGVGLARVSELAFADPNQLVLHLDPLFAFEPMGRNPFEFSVPASETAAIEPRPVLAEPSPSAPTQSDDRNESLTGKLKLGGVVYRNGKRYAYLLEGGQGHVVGVGAVIFDRYKIEDISVRSLLLKDMSSGAESRLFLSEM